MKKRNWTSILVSATLLASLVLASCSNIVEPPSQPFKLTILHTSENHGHWEPTVSGNVSQGGIARRATLVRKLREENPNTLLLDSGDVSQGTLFFNQYRGSEGREFYNLLGYDAVVAGNHEFDAGPRVLADNFLDGAKFTVVVSNMDFSGEPALAGKIPATAVKEVGGQKIGLLGLVTEEVITTSSPGSSIKMIDTVKAARDAVARLSSQKVDKIVLLSHLGFPADQHIASKVSGIDVIVSGHTETLMGDPAKTDPSLGVPTAPYPVVVNHPDGSPTLIVHDFIWGRELGDLNVVFTGGRITSWSGNPVLVDKTLADDPGVAQKLTDLSKPLDELKKRVVGKTAVNLDGSKATVRNRESNLGNLVADAALWSTSRDNTLIALVNGGGMRASIPAGDITMGQVLQALPFGNRLVQFDVTGSELMAALENGVSTMDGDPEKSGGRFLQVAGIKFTADMTKAAGSRMVDAQVGTENSGFQPVDKGATYRVVSLDYILGGGDGYTMLKNARNVRGGDVPEEQAVISFLSSVSSISPAVEGRITINR